MTMPAFPVRRLILAAAFGATVAMSPLIAVFTGPGPTTVATCPDGESADPYTYACVPELVPNGAGANSGTSEQQLTECTGEIANCREEAFYGTPPPGI